jgi:Glycosyl transferase family 90
MTDFSGAPVMDFTYMEKHSYKGYISNYTLSTSICHQPDLQGLHGAFIEPISINASTRLFPIFGGSKLMTNNDLLIPAPMYWDKKDHRFVATGGSGDPWENKDARVIWRGVASGGRNKANNWKGFHRHRFVAMTNATQVRRAENWEEFPLNWVRPPKDYNIQALNDHHLSDWLDTSVDSAFIDLNCYPEQPKGQCNHTGNWFKTVPAVKMPAQYHNKLLVDIDGNSFSGRYRAFLMSNSLPIKATLFREWHDSRLVAWKHFVPMDNRFIDFFGLMEYFLGYPNLGSGDPTSGVVKPHDHMAKKIATEGQEWALKVLRREDMQLYTLRLLLEYARVIDDRREKLGFVDDLIS